MKTVIAVVQLHEVHFYEVEPAEMSMRHDGSWLLRAYGCEAPGPLKPPYFPAPAGPSINLAGISEEAVLAKVAEAARVSDMVRGLAPEPAKAPPPDDADTPADDEQKWDRF